MSIAALDNLVKIRQLAIEHVMNMKYAVCCIWRKRIWRTRNSRQYLWKGAICLRTLPVIRQG